MIPLWASLITFIIQAMLLWCKLTLIDGEMQKRVFPDDKEVCYIFTSLLRLYPNIMNDVCWFKTKVFLRRIVFQFMFRRNVEER